MLLSRLAELLGARLVAAGDVSSVHVDHVASHSLAGSRDVIFVESPRFLEPALTSRAGAIIGGEFLAEAGAKKPVLIVPHPRLGFARAADVLDRDRIRPSGVHATALIDPTAKLSEGVSIGPYAVVGARSVIGANTTLGPGCIISEDVVIGSDCALVARVTVYAKSRIGNRVVVHAGAVLGSDGFGFVRDEQTGAYEKFPQIGWLEIGDDVEIGANSTVDRGALESTVISSGVKLDNMVHVGHNARLGKNVVIAAQTGISGSSVLEDNVLVGGQVGIADHVRIEEGAILGAQCGVPSKKTLRGKGVIFWGTPARPIGEYLKELAVLSRMTRGKKTR